MVEQNGSHRLSKQRLRSMVRAPSQQVTLLYSSHTPVGECSAQAALVDRALFRLGQDLQMLTRVMYPRQRNFRGTRTSVRRRSPENRNRKHQASSLSRRATI